MAVALIVKTAFFLGFFIPIHGVKVEMTVSCRPAPWTKAIEMCKQQGKDILTSPGNITESIAQAYKNASMIVGGVWIYEDGSECKILNEGNISQVNCSETSHYLCIQFTPDDKDSVILHSESCPAEESTTHRGENGKTTSARSGETIDTAGNSTDDNIQRADSTTQNNNPNQSQALDDSHLPTSTMIAILVGSVLVLFAVIAFAVVCYKKRKKQPVKYAVREESAKYHTSHPVPPLQEGSNVNADDYDVLWKHNVNGAGSKVKDDGSSAAYGHIMPNRTTDGLDQANDSDYDSAVIVSEETKLKYTDNIYQRTYLPETTTSSEAPES